MIDNADIIFITFASVIIDNVDCYLSDIIDYEGRSMVDNVMDGISTCQKQYIVLTWISCGSSS